MSPCLRSEVLASRSCQDQDEPETILHHLHCPGRVARSRVSRTSLATLRGYCRTTSTTMGGKYSKISDKRYKHHEDPIALNAQTLAAREHMYGDCDVVIVVKDHRFPAHRDILSEHSAYFRSMFGHFSEKYSESIELRELVKPKHMAQLIHFMYFQNIYMSPQNAQELLVLATYLQMDQLVQTVSHFIRERIDHLNCVPLYAYTLTMGPQDLQCHAEDYTMKHFEEIVTKTSAIASLTMEILLKIISSERLITSEELTFKAVLQWVSQDICGRSAHLPALLAHVHFPLMSLSELDHLSKDPRVKKVKSQHLNKSLQEAREYHSMTMFEKQQHWSCCPKPRRWPKLFLVMRLHQHSPSLECLDFDGSGSWRELAPVRNWRACTSLASRNNTVYLVGGEESDPDSPTGSRTVNRVTSYDCERRQWVSVTSMKLARRWGAALVVGDVLYVTGGIGGRGGTFERRLDSMECLDLSSASSRWQSLPVMSATRSSHAMAHLDGRLYVVGGGGPSAGVSGAGAAGDTKTPPCSAEVYNIKTQQWTRLADLKTKRWKCGLCAVDGYLYAVGGLDSQNFGVFDNPLRSVERYCPSTGRWEELEPMLDARFGCSAVGYKGKVYVAGGFGSLKNHLNSTECYDPKTGRWKRVQAMGKVDGFLGGVLVDRPVNFGEAEAEAEGQGEKGAGAGAKVAAGAGGTLEGPRPRSERRSRLRLLGIGTL